MKHSLRALFRTLGEGGMLTLGCMWLNDGGVRVTALHRWSGRPARQRTDGGKRHARRAR